MTLSDVKRFRVSVSVIRKTVESIRSAGREGYELFVIWSGTHDGELFSVEEAHVPQQSSYKLDTGLCVYVDDSELHRLNVWLYEAQQVIGAQVHSHPTEAYHSETDDTYPISTLDGSLSIVLPFFGRDGWDAEGIAAYRLGSHGWCEICTPLTDIIEVIGDVPS